MWVGTCSTRGITCGDAIGDVERDRLAAAATRTIEAWTRGFESSIVARTVITLLDLERTYGLTGGHIFHGELSLDQWFVTRPLLGGGRATARRLSGSFSAARGRIRARGWMGVPGC